MKRGKKFWLQKKRVGKYVHMNLPFGKSNGCRSGNMSEERTVAVTAVLSQNLDTVDYNFRNLKEK